jgi:hypothetical protein
VDPAFLNCAESLYYELLYKWSLGWNSLLLGWNFKMPICICVYIKGMIIIN